MTDSMPHRHNTWSFLTLACLLSWTFWIPAAIISHRAPAFPAGILHLLGGFGPSIAGIIMVHRSYDDDRQQDFWQRVFSFKRIGKSWYAFIVLFFPVLAAICVLVEVMAGRPAPFFPSRWSSYED
ncbi:MAG: hypothetical protein JXA42_03815 [Anaerolineales bacterium]|nr:hypothetical protein [Anaerolineales bacterium]